MHTGLLVESNCELPAALIDHSQVVIQPPDNEAFRQFLLEKLIYQYDHLLLISPQSSGAERQSAVQKIIQECLQSIACLRRQARLTLPFKLRVLQSHTLFTGYGLVLYEALRLLHQKNRSADQLRHSLESFCCEVQCYLLPGQFARLRSPLQQSWLHQNLHRLQRTLPTFLIDERGVQTMPSLPQNNSLSEFLIWIGNTLGECTLRNRLVNISYAGDLPSLRVMPAFQRLHQQIASLNGRLACSQMSDLNRLQLGRKAMTVAFAP